MIRSLPLYYLCGNGNATFFIDYLDKIRHLSKYTYLYHMIWVTKGMMNVFYSSPEYILVIVLSVESLFKQYNYAF